MSIDININCASCGGYLEIDKEYLAYHHYEIEVERCDCLNDNVRIFLWNIINQMEKSTSLDEQKKFFSSIYQEAKDILKENL